MDARGRRIGDVRARRFVPLGTLERLDELEATLSANCRAFGSITNVADTPTARAWQAISRAAHDLPEAYPHRLFIIDLAQTGVVAIHLLKRHKLNKMQAHRAFERFLAEHDMDAFRGLLVGGPTRGR